MTKTSSPKGDSAMSKSADWRDATPLLLIRKLIEQADPEAVEERKWVKAANPQGVPTWSHDGIICTGKVQEPCEGDFRQGRLSEGSLSHVQLQLGRQPSARHRFSRGREGRREGVQGSHPRSCALNKKSVSRK